MSLSRPLVAVYLVAFVLTVSWVIKTLVDGSSNGTVAALVLISTPWLLVGPGLVVAWERRAEGLALALDGEASVESGWGSVGRAMSLLDLARPLIVAVPVLLVVVAYFAGGSNWAGYVASKTYVLSFTRGLAAELRGTGVTVTVLSPGTAATDFVSDARVGNTRAYRWLPKVSTKHVAEVGYRAAMNGRTTVVPGLINSLLAFLGELQPRGLAQGVFSFLSGVSKERVVTSTLPRQHGRTRRQ